MERAYTPFRQSYKTILIETWLTLADRLLTHFFESPLGMCVQELARALAVCRAILKPI